MKILGMRCYGITMPNEVQPREYSRGGGKDDILYNIATFNQWNDDKRNVNVNRNNSNDWNDNWWFAGLRNSLISLSQSWESFVL